MGQLEPICESYQNLVADSSSQNSRNPTMSLVAKEKPTLYGAVSRAKSVGPWNCEKALQFTRS